MSDPNNSRGGRPTTLFPNAGSTTAGKIARQLREERERAEAAARAEIEAEAVTEMPDPLLNPPPPRDANTVTSFGQPIPEAPEPPQLSPKKPELKYSDSPYAPEWAKHPSQRKPPPPVPEEKLFRPEVEWFEKLLWKETSDDVRVYCIMDGYWAKGLYGRLLAAPDISWAHIFQGDVALNNIQDAPFIIALRREHKLLRWLIEEGWGNGWGIYFTASTKAALDRYGKTTRLPPDMTPSNEEKLKLCNLVEGMADPLWLMRRHFRRFSDVEFEDDGRIVDFRYYDPATICVYLPSCNEEELSRFHGPVRCFYAEGYCDWAAANRPQDIFSFSLKESGAKAELRFDAKRLDTASGHTYMLPTSISSKERSERSGSGFPIIRTAQVGAFGQFRKSSFMTEVIALMQGLLTQKGRKAEPEKLRVFIEEQFAAAASYNLKTEFELIAFSGCAIAFGGSFFQKHSEISHMLEKHKSNPSEETGINLMKRLKCYLAGEI